MTADLTNCRLVYVAPRSGVGAIGDYAQGFAAAIRPLFGEVVEHRHGSPGDDSVADLRRHRAAVRDLVRGGPVGRVLVHTELSGGSVVPFWSTAGIDDVPVTATVHDPPQLIWWPARTRFMATHKLINHGVHFPLQTVSRAVQRAAATIRTLFALTETGCRSIEEEYPRARAVHVPHLVFDRPTIRPAPERPRAVGFFGMIYRGKGFEEVVEMRRHLPGDIAIRVAGRGTENLPRTEGIDIVGAVDGEEEDAFFASVRALVVPYGRRTFYGGGKAFPSSAVIAHATAYRTPVICSDHGALRELGSESGALVVRSQAGDTDTPVAFAAAITSLLRDDDLLDELSRHTEETRRARLGPRVAEAFASTWSDVMDGFAGPK
jgi:glycosyltransferase involved in cell wall biosynthesis